MDDIAWSEPVPRRRAAAELDPPSWIKSDGTDRSADERGRDVPGSNVRVMRDHRPGSSRDDSNRSGSSREDGHRPGSRRHDGRRYEGSRDDASRPTAGSVSAEGSRPTVGGFHAEDYLDQRSGADLSHGRTALPVRKPEVIDYTDAVDDEEIWGPRPKLVATGSGGRRTVVITGRGDDRAVVTRGPSRDDHPVHARHGLQADRTAMWAVLLCVIVLFAAIATH
jgi:hypothetical protein